MKASGRPRAGADRAAKATAPGESVEESDSAAGSGTVAVAVAAAAVAAAVAAAAAAAAAVAVASVGGPAADCWCGRSSSFRGTRSRWCAAGRRLAAWRRCASVRWAETVGCPWSAR